jgi:alpha-mannosidase
MFADSPTSNEIIYASVVALAWALRETLTLLKNKRKSLADISTGETLPSYWEKQFEDTRRLISDSKSEQINAMRDLTNALNILTVSILKGSK